MICQHCSDANNYKTEKAQRVRHLMCTGKGWCDCQHRVGEVAKREQKP